MNVSAHNGLPLVVSDLAKILPFPLGPLHVEPAARQICIGDRKEVLEPKVMRVLVVLGMTPWRVLSRDDLLELCWDGQVVTDNAIDRVLSLLRKTLDALAGDAVKLKTITKVGFVIVVEEQLAGVSLEPVWVPPPSPTPTVEVVTDTLPPSTEKLWTRRAWLGGVALAGIGVTAGYVAWRNSNTHTPDPRAADLYARGMILQKSGVSGSMRQAMEHYWRAIDIDPQHADAWGALAIGYRHGGDGFVKGPREAFPRLVRSAAGRALALNPDQPDALTALATIESEFGRWDKLEARLREVVRRVPDYWFGWAQLDLLMQNVGRFDEGVGYRQRVIEIDTMIPAVWSLLARGLHYAGRDHEADIALRKAFDLWPAHPMLWQMRFAILIGGERYLEALSFAQDSRQRPEQIPTDQIESSLRLAEALANQEGMERILNYLRQLQGLPIEAVPFFAPSIARLGDMDMAFDWLMTYYFGGELNGQRIAPPKSFESRDTSVLFAPAIIAHQSDLRFGELLSKTGLEDYWRRSGTQPDFRK